MGDAVAFLATYPGPVDRIVLHPHEGMTTGTILTDLGGRTPHLLSPLLVKAVLRATRSVARLHPRISACHRRLEVLWIGQDQVLGWFAGRGWEPPAGPARWREWQRRGARQRRSTASARTPGRRTICVAAEHRCWTDPEGHLRGRKSLTAVSTFDEIGDVVVAVRTAQPEPSGVPLLSFPHRSLLLPWPAGVGGAGRLLTAAARIWRQVGDSDAVTVYCPGVIGTVTGTAALVRRRPLVVVVVGDPSSSLGADVVGRLTSIAARPLVIRAMRWFCRRAVVARYVTSHALQESYPPGRATTVVAGSDVGPVPVHTVRAMPTGRVVILTVGTLDREYKGVRELVSAVRTVVDRGYDVELRVAGTGRLEKELRTLADSLLGPRATFVGHVTGEALEALYDTSDLFVLASWTEGLPRVLIEAMAAGLPCVATAVGGVAELVEEEHLVAPRDAPALARAIEALLADDDAWARSSAANVERARAVIERSVAADAEFVDAVKAAMRDDA